MRIQSAGSSPVWMRLIEQSNIPLGLALEVEEAPDLESARATALYSREIPGLQFGIVDGTAAEDESGEEALELSYLPASTLAASIAGKVSRLGEPITFQRIERGADEEKPTAKRPYTGTIPDYADDVGGLRLSGVLEGGPAEEAGLREGDVIVEFAGTVVEDVYGYAEVLDRLEIDVPVAVVFMRDGERRETTLTPRGR